MIPDQIPGHYDSAGVINRWTSKSGLWIVYFVGIIMFAGLSVIEHFPKTWNTGVAITKENQKTCLSINKRNDSNPEIMYHHNIYVFNTVYDFDD